ncbi:protein YhfH [Aquibacillus kalidii]|nr:protein YhfH [Aquibacillus kalidii]
MKSIVEFYRNLPRKKCSKCGKDFIEQAECYSSLCEKCDHPAL